MMPGEHVFMPEVDWMGSSVDMFEPLVERRQEPPRFAVGQLWRTRGGQIRRITEVGPALATLPITTVAAARGGVDHIRLHRHDGTHWKIAHLDLVERVPGEPMPWHIVFWALVLLSIVALAVIAEVRT